MGSPSRNVQYHPPRLSEDRLNLAQPHSPSLPTHCSGKSGMRPWRGQVDGVVVGAIPARRTRRRPEPPQTEIDPVTSELFDQQSLVGVLPAQPIRTVDEHDLDVARGRHIAHPFQSQPFERRPAIAVVREDPVPRHFEIECHRPLDQRRRLARDRVRFAPVRGHARVNRRHLHVDAPFRRWQPDASGRAPATRRRGRAC